MCKLQGSETIRRTQLKSVWEPHLLCPTNMYVSALTCFCILEWTQLSEKELSDYKVDLCLSSSLHATNKAPSTNFGGQIRCRLLLYIHFLFKLLWAVLFLIWGPCRGLLIVWMTGTWTKYDLFFQRGLLLDVVFDGIFFSPWIKWHHTQMLFFFCFCLLLVFASTCLVLNLWGLVLEAAVSER